MSTFLSGITCSPKGIGEGGSSDEEFTAYVAGRFSGVIRVKFIPIFYSILWQRDIVFFGLHLVKGLGGGITFLVLFMLCEVQFSGVRGFKDRSIGICRR